MHPVISSSIISSRKPTANSIQNIRASIAKVTASFDRMLPVCHSVLNDETLAPDFAGMSEILALCIKPVNELRRLNEGLALLQTRFSRDTLNLAVIGRARQLPHRETIHR